MKLLAPFITLIIAILQLLLNYKWRDKRTKKFKRGHFLLFLLLIVAAFSSGLIIYIDDNREETLNRQLNLITLQNDSLKTLVNRIEQEIVKVNVSLEPFVNFAKQRFPEQDTKEALEKLAGELKELRRDVTELKPFKLNQKFKKLLSLKLENLIQFEKDLGFEKVEIEFVLFPQQTPEASELVQFMRLVFKASERDTKISMVHNSGIPPNLRGIIFKVKNYQRPPTLFKEFNSLMKSMNFQIYIINDKRMRENQLQVSAQRPTYFVENAEKVL